MAMTKKCLLYCTKGKPEIVTFDIKDGGTQPHPSTPINGKIVAECDVETEEIKIFDKVNWKNEWENKLEESCLTINQLENYLSSNDYKGYALFIKNLKIFDKYKELKDYCVDNSKYYKDYGWCLTCKEMYTPIQKAPQNMMWCFDKDNNYKMKVLISIRPEWMCKILNGEKTIEIRKKVLRGMLDD